MSTVEIHRLAAFTTDPAGGNPAGVVLSDEALEAAEMQRIAADVGFSETAFAVPMTPPARWRLRYFAPETEVPFCGHATIATGVLLGRRYGATRLVFETPAGAVPVTVDANGGHVTATLTSVTPDVAGADRALVDDVLRTMHWDRSALRDDLPPAVAYAGARHLVLVVRTRALLAALRYEFSPLRQVMEATDLTTVAVIWQQTPVRFHARNPFPVGGVVEDPATGAAAAAFGAYLRDRDALAPPTTVEIVQGEDMGRPSRLVVSIPEGVGGIDVTGTAVALP